MVFQDSAKPCRGDFHLAVYKGGEIIDRVDDHNLVVDAGRIRLAELAAGKSGSCITKIGVGSGSSGRLMVSSFAAGSSAGAKGACGASSLCALPKKSTTGCFSGCSVFSG